MWLFSAQLVSFSLLPQLLFSQRGLSYDFEILHGLLNNKNIRVPIKKKLRAPLPPHYANFGQNMGVFLKVVLGSEMFKVRFQSD